METLTFDSTSTANAKKRRCVFPGRDAGKQMKSECFLALQGRPPAKQNAGHDGYS